MRFRSPAYIALASCLLATGCGALLPGWLSLPLAGQSADSSGRTAFDGSPNPPAACPPAGDPALAKQPPLPQPVKLASKDMAQYVSELSKGVELEQSRQYNDARDVFRQLIQKWPGEYEAYHHLGQLCDRQRHFIEAQDCYERAILLSGSREPTIFNDLGYSFYLQGHLQKAESALRKAVALRPNEQKFHNNLGLVLGHEGHYDDAWKEFRAAGGEADAYYNLAFVKASQKDFEGAKACFRRALTVDPAHQGAARALRAFELADSDPDSVSLLDTDSDDTVWVPYVENAPGANAAGSATDATSVPGIAPPTNRTHGRTVSVNSAN